MPLVTPKAVNEKNWDGQQVCREQTATSDPEGTFFKKSCNPHHYSYKACTVPDALLNGLHVLVYLLLITTRWMGTVLPKRKSSHPEAEQLSQGIRTGLVSAVRLCFHTSLLAMLPGARAWAEAWRCTLCLGEIGAERINLICKYDSKLCFFSQLFWGMIDK